MEEIENIIKAFTESNFQKLIQNKLCDIETILNEFIYKQNNEYLQNSEIKISSKILSRIKSKESLREKLSRKNYINEWKINILDEKSIQDIICKNLPDLIGFRINCYFKEDEETIFNQLIKFLDENKCIAIEENFNRKQKNGHTIYKVACRYEELSNIFSFEVQVKSLLHDVWGEVEHSIIYKGRSYDSRENLKKDIVEGIYTILDGADKQLNKLYLFKPSVKEIKHELFYEYSKDDLGLTNSILSEHYQNFFDLISYFKNSEECIDRYLGKKLLEQKYDKEEICDLDSIYSNNRIDISQFKNKFDNYKFNMFCNIASILYDYKSEDILLNNLIKGIYDESNTSTDNEFGDANFEEDNRDAIDTIDITIMEVLSCIGKK